MWKKQDEPIEVDCYAIVQVKKEDGRWKYREVVTSQGSWFDLVFELWSNYKIFDDEITLTKSSSEKYNKMDEIGDRLSKLDRPYEFKLPDGTDWWYYAYCKPVSFRVDHEGKLR